MTRCVLWLSLLAGCSTVSAPPGDARTPRDVTAPDLQSAPADATADAPADGAPGETTADATTATHRVLRGAEVVGLGVLDVELEGDRIVRVGQATRDSDVRLLTGRFIVPAWIDAHVHLAYLPMADALARGGVAVAVDLAAPESFLDLPHAPLVVLASGPMITSPFGYPLDSWGRDGYGLGVMGAARAEETVDRLADRGARLIKVPMGFDGIGETELAAVVARAHARGLRVYAHALNDADARRAADAGVDVLAHTPVRTLAPETLEAWRGRAVISTLGAFGGGAETVENLRALRAHGARVLYGTDFGNTEVPGVDPRELTLLGQAGLSGSDVLACGTSDSADFLGLTEHGKIEAGRRASLLVLDADPRTDPLTLARPRAVVLDGVLVSGALD